MEKTERNWDFHLRKLSNIARDSNTANDPASDPLLLQSVRSPLLILCINFIYAPNFSIIYILGFHFSFIRWKSFIKFVWMRILRTWLQEFILKLTRFSNVLWPPFLNLIPQMAFSYLYVFFHNICHILF